MRARENAESRVGAFRWAILRDDSRLSSARLRLFDLPPAAYSR